MGVIQEYKCPGCRKTWKLFTGHGMNHGTLNRVLGAFPPKIQAKILEDKNSSGELEPLFLFNYRPSFCRQCQDLIAVPFLQFLESGHTYIGECPKCGNTPELLKESDDSFCPKCMKQSLSCQETGHWD